MVRLPTLLSRKSRQEERKDTSKDVDKMQSVKSDAVSTQASEMTSTTSTASDHSIKGGRFMGGAVKSLLKHFDHAALGVKFVLGETRVDAYHGKISIDGLTIQNPEGYSSEYLLYAAKLLVDLDMKTLIKSMGKTLEIEQVLLEDVDVIYEKSWSTSNADEISKRLNNSRAAKTPKVKADKVIVHKVLLSNIGAKACTTLGSAGPRLALGDISYEDLDAELGAQTVVDAVGLVMETLVKSLVATLLGKESCKSAWGVLAQGKSRVRLAASRLCQQISELGDCSSCRSCHREEEVIVDEKPSVLLDDGAAHGTV